MPANPIYKFHVELMDTKLKIWREFEVVNNYSMAKFGYIIMALFNMDAKHLWQFEVPYKEYEKPTIDLTKIENEYARNTAKYESEFYRIGIPDPDKHFNFIPVKGLDATKIKLSKVMTTPSDSIILYYDFGDDWRVEVTLKEVYIDNGVHGREFPRVLNGEGYGIIDDCGGVGELEKIAKAYTKKSGKIYNDYVEFFNVDDFDINSFDAEKYTYATKCANSWMKQVYEYYKE